MKLKEMFLIFSFLVINFASLQNARGNSMEEGYIDVQGGKIWYQIFYTCENRKRPPLILLHGGPGVPHNYLLNLSDLSKDRPIIVYDQLGCGKSTVERENLNLWVLPRFVDELESLVHALNINQFYLFGHSWGGSLAIEYALQYPQKIKGLILASPVLSTRLWIEDAKQLLEQLPLETQEAIKKHERAGSTNSVEYQQAKNLYNRFLCRLDQWPKDLQYSLDHINLKIYETMWGSSEFHATGNLKKFDRMKDLSKLQMPVLITCGRFDEATPETMKIANSKLKNGKLLIFEKSAHVSHLEEPSLYKAELSNWMTAIE